MVTSITVLLYSGPSLQWSPLQWSILQTPSTVVLRSKMINLHWFLYSAPLNSRLLYVQWSPLQWSLSSGPSLQWSISAVVSRYKNNGLLFKLHWFPLQLSPKQHSSLYSGPSLRCSLLQGFLYTEDPWSIDLYSTWSSLNWSLLQ